MVNEALRPPTAADDAVGSWRDAKRRRTGDSGEEDDYAAASCLVLLADDAPTTTGRDAAGKDFPYACGHCGKTFRSFQALGGHKTGHRSKPVSEARDSSAAAVSASGRVHRCVFCQRVFPTGQALGGHMRKHYDGVIRKTGRAGGKRGATCGSEDGSGASGITSADGGGDDVMAPVRLNMDLNFSLLPPPPEVGAVGFIKFL
ncbi:zinc finger protein [Striga asiatica]|uniref:Zinc finger protein n=1 Tax=Striga asiatica TaxID=4170 RepID=A0A5A7QD71_STRAF|nr:zinc finger protein [Striga asiatica]